jgi:carbonic anhydrase
MCDHPRHDHKPTRRTILAGSAALAASPLMAWPAFSQTATPQNAISPDAALKRLLDGNARYVANQPEVRDFSAGRAARTTAQYPIVAVLSCSDARVAPELVFDQGPGDVFAVRVAGNFAFGYGTASLEYAVAVLNVPLIMVLGHTNCGAVDAAIKVIKDDLKLPGLLPQLVASIKPAVRAAKTSNPADLLTEAIAENVRQNVKRLSSHKPILAERVAQKKIEVVGGIYDIPTGKVAII